MRGVHRATAAAVPRLADGQGRDARRPPAVGRRRPLARPPERRPRRCCSAPASTGSCTSACRRASTPTCASSSSTSRPSRSATNVPAEVGLVGDGKAVMAQLNAALAADAVAVPGRDAVARRRSPPKIEDNRGSIEAMAADDTVPMNYYRAFRDIREAIPRDAIIVSEGANTMDIGRTLLDNLEPAHPPRRRQLRHDGRRLRLRHRRRRRPPATSAVVSVSGDSAFGFCGMEVETICRYDLPITTIVLNNGGIGGGFEDWPADQPAAAVGACRARPATRRSSRRSAARATTSRTRPTCARRSTRRSRPASRRSSTSSSPPRPTASPRSSTGRPEVERTAARISPTLMKGPIGLAGTLRWSAWTLFWGSMGHLPLARAGDLG